MTDEEFLKRFGRNVSDARHELGISQTELANRIGTSSSKENQRSYISRLESGNRNPGIVLVHRMSIALNVPMSKLLGEDNRFNLLTKENQMIISTLIDKLLMNQ